MELVGAKQKDTHDERKTETDNLLWQREKLKGKVDILSKLSCLQMLQLYVAALWHL